MANFLSKNKNTWNSTAMVVVLLAEVGLAAVVLRTSLRSLCSLPIAIAADIFASSLHVRLPGYRVPHPFE